MKMKKVTHIFSFSIYLKSIKCIEGFIFVMFNKNTNEGHLPIQNTVYTFTK